ncbi:hypothetical protein ACED29_09425 [Shewanella sp. 5S214]|uniref:hypothetical protein n=1 Tax=Shewanella sp. 5S214 TaxID=3229999 RepID=UPI00352E7360
MNKLPVVIFIFKRQETLDVIFERVREYNPNKIYLIADAGRNSAEEKLVKATRDKALNLIDWDCEVIQDFAETNKGVYDRIGKGALRVFEREKAAIFLEDDNYPSTTFFKYCEEMISKYEGDDDIAWICGTNYLGDSSYIGKEDYYYTRHLLPCGWASWSAKFTRIYDGDLITLNDATVDLMKSTYIDKRLFDQEIHTVRQAKINLNRNPKLVSWDRQMCYSIRSRKVLGIAPKVNLIKNIGVDHHSEHGGDSMDKPMTARFCGVDNYEINFPLTSPSEKDINYHFESENEAVILYPFSLRLKRNLGRFIKRVFFVDPNDNIGTVKTKLSTFVKYFKRSRK